MTLDVTPLFQPLTVRNKTLRNRIVMPPMVDNRPLESADAVAWYGARARGGAGMVIVEATRLYQFDAQLTAASLRPLVCAIHSGGALAAIQLYPMLANRLRDPEALSLDDIEALATAYARVGAICRDAGFDAVEPHGAHGYLLNRFFSPELNRRRDAYGGDTLPGRTRLAVEIVRRLRPVCGEAMLLLYRHTPEGLGYGVADSLVLAERLVDAGVDILDLSPSSVTAPGDLAAPFKTLGSPVIAVNDLDVIPRAVETLAAGRADLVAIGRGLIADPEWPTKVQAGRENEIIRCIKCGGCGDLQARGLPVTCTQWAQGGQD